MLAAMDSRELSEWMAFDRVEPLPDSYWQAGLICATVGNAMGSRRALSPADFLPAPRHAPPPVQAPEVGLARFKAFVGAASGRLAATPE